MLCSGTGASSPSGTPANKGDDCTVPSGQRTKPRSVVPHTHTRPLCYYCTSSLLRSWHFVTWIPRRYLEVATLTKKARFADPPYWCAPTVRASSSVQEVCKPKVPIVHFTAARLPFLLCVKWVSLDTVYSDGTFLIWTPLGQ